VAAGGYRKLSILTGFSLSLITYELVWKIRVWLGAKPTKIWGILQKKHPRQEIFHLRLRYCNLFNLSDPSSGFFRATKPFSPPLTTHTSEDSTSAVSHVENESHISNPTARQLTKRGTRSDLWKFRALDSNEYN
jgi:hypothetical protein